MIRGVREYRDFAGRLGSWGVRSDVFDINLGPKDRAAMVVDRALT